MPKAYNPDTEEIFQLAGDEDDGMSATHLLNRNLPRPQLRYKGKYGDYVITADIHQTPESLAVHIICPKCRKALWIKAEHKKIEWDASSQLLSVEPSKCSWELEGDVRRMEFGLGLCNFTFAIDENMVKDA